MGRVAKLSLALGGFLGLAGAPLLAAEAGFTDTWFGLPLWFWASVNLFVFWGLLYRFAFPHVREFFVKRRQNINASLDHAGAQRLEAESMRDELARQIAELESDIDQLVARASAEGERERERILAQAEEERVRLIEQAKSEIQHRSAQARAELVELTARLAAGLAKERVERELTDADRRRLFQRGLEQLEEKVS